MNKGEPVKLPLPNSPALNLDELIPRKIITNTPDQALRTRRLKKSMWGLESGRHSQYKLIGLWNILKGTNINTWKMDFFLKFFFVDLYK